MIVRELYESIMLLEYSRKAMLRQFGLKLAQKSGPVDQQNPEEVAEKAASILSMLEWCDPSNNNQFSEWIVLTYLRDPAPFDKLLTFKVKQRLMKFMDLKQRQQQHLLPDANINNYKTFNQFIRAIDAVLVPPKGINSKGTSEEVYRDETVRVIVPKNEAAAIYYGQGTHWCTAWVPPRTNRFSRYTHPLYILIPTRPNYPGEKYQLYFNPNQSQLNECSNEKNVPVSAEDLLTARFPGLLDNVFSEHKDAILGSEILTDPEFDDDQAYFENLNDAAIIHLLTSIQTYMKPFIKQYLEAWSDNDPDYMEYLDHEADEYGEHDYSHVQSYLEYNPEAKDWLDTVHSLFNFKTVNQFRNMVADFNMFDDALPVNELFEVFFSRLEDIISDRQDNGTNKYGTIFGAIENMSIERVNNVWTVANIA